MEPEAQSYTQTQTASAAPAPPPSSSSSDLRTFLPVPRHLLARLLYCNPACALISRNLGSSGSFNAMTISWLTPVANDGGAFLLSMNTGRHTFQNLSAAPLSLFTLSPAVEGMQQQLLAIGSCSGREPADAPAAASSASSAPSADKLGRLGLSVCASSFSAEALAAEAARASKRQRKAEPAQAPAWAQEAAELPCLLASPARLLCRVQQQALGQGSVPHHALLLCEVLSATVDARYWQQGKLFAAPSGSQLPRLLCFAGSKRFQAMQLLEEERGGGGGGGEGGAGGIEAIEEEGAREGGEEVVQLTERGA
jgi:flavin reductase (DIM6/NTAB) family NADH-FMN oxidoreductase RutF